METRRKYFSLIKIPAWLSAEFAETMFLLTGDLWIFDKAIGEDPASDAISRGRSSESCYKSTKIQHVPFKFKCYFLELKTLTSF